MTKLTEDIYRRLLKKEGIDTCEDGNPITASICKAHAEQAAEVCKGYIERAFDAGFNRGMWVEGMREEPEPMHKTEFVNLLFPEKQT